SMLDTLGALYVEGRTITINGTRADGGEDSEVAHILPLSARSAGALEDLAREFVRRLEAPGEGTARDICYTAAARRAHLDHRLAVVAATRRELSARLDGVLRGEEPAGVARGRVRLAGRPRIVFAFAGQGPQWWGIGRDLLEREPVFRSVVYQCRDLLAAHADWDLLEELMRDEASSRLNESEVAQPALFAFQVALAALWRSWGIEPEAVVGHSMGEVAAAHVAGALSLEDAVRVIYRRGRVMQEAAGRGAMVAVQLPAERADDPLTDYRDSVSIAALNGPGWVVLSGDAAAIAELTRNLEASGVTCRPLSVDYASHSPQMEPCRHALTASVQGIEALAPTIPIYSTVTGGLATGAGFFDAEYWGRNIRQPVLFAPTIGALVREGYSHFIEIGAHPILATMILECAVAAGTEVSALASLRRGQPGRVTMLTSLGALYVDGCEVNWAGVNPKGGRFVRLPNYPWQRKRYWFKRQSERARRRRVTGAVAAHSAGLPGRRLHVAVPTFESQVDPDLRAFALDHRVDGGAFVPASLFVELGLAAAERALGPGAYGIEDLSIDEPLVCREGDARTVQVT